MKAAALILAMVVVVLDAQVPPSLANPRRECQENEYLDERGQCNPCRECGPGLELSKECGYGEGSQAQCVPCHPRRFKDRWGHHGCKPCLSCALINRVQRANCTSTNDAACGECLPGFYSKTQIGGLRDLECVPCTKQTPFSELQCRSKVNLEQVESPPASAGELPLVVLTSTALVIIVLVVMTVSILYCQRFWKHRCQRVFGRSQRFPEQRVTFQPPVTPVGFSCRETVLSLPCLHLKSSNPRHQSAEDPVEVVQHILDAKALERRLPGGHPDVELSRLIALNPKAPLAGNLVEVQPLIRNSGCSDCSAGGSSISEFRLDPGGDPTCPALQPTCATEVEHRWPHAPVECTELDLQKFSTQRDFVDTPRNGVAERDLGSSLEVTSEAPAYSVSSVRKGSSLDSIEDSYMSFRNPIVESGGQMGEDVQSLVTKIGDLARDVPIGSLPDPLVMCLAFHLNPSLPGLNNVFHLGMELGVPPHQLSQISGFTELVAYLADSGDPLPVATLAKVLEKFQCFDALRLLYGHFTGSQTQNSNSN